MFFFWFFKGLVFFLLIIGFWNIGVVFKVWVTMGFFRVWA